jgi:SAM-dependent methyltransferase
MKGCRLCEEKSLKELFDFGLQPIAHRLLSSLKDIAEYQHPLKVHSCESCGLIQIVDPISQEELYSNYNWFSEWKAQPHQNVQIEELLQGGFLNEDSFVFEIGCNDGLFLSKFRKHGISNVLGLEPTLDASSKAKERGLNVINSYFNSDTVDGLLNSHPCPDVIVCQNVLEHIESLSDFMKGIASFLKPEGTVLLEVPDIDYQIANGDISLIWEEHVNYFSEETLTYLFRINGLIPRKFMRFPFSGQGLVVIAQKEKIKAETQKISKTGNKDEEFLEKSKNFKENLFSFLEEKKESGAKIAIYGAGLRANLLINVLNLSRYVSMVIDDQPEKQNKFMPKSHLPILPRSTLLEEKVDLCLLAVNEESESAVVKNNSEFLKLGGEFKSLLPGSPLCDLLRV